MCTWYRYSTAILRKWGTNLLPVAIANSKHDCVLTATVLLPTLPVMAVQSTEHPPWHDRHGSALWLAIGVLVTRLRLRRQSPRPLGIEWRYVSTRREPARLPLAADRPDAANATRFGMGAKIQMGFQFSCFCKTAMCFAGVMLFPTARFVGKMEVTRCCTTPAC